MTYMTIDSETNIKNVGDDAVGKMKADPFHPDNHVVWWGWKREGNSLVKARKDRHLPRDWLSGIQLLVGQNIKFDLLYLWKDNPELHDDMDRRELQLWDTQLAEYLLTGQEHKWASLDELATKYGGTIKDSKMKEYWDNGVDTEDIPNSEVVPYLDGDVENTELVFLKQLTRAYKMDMLPLIMSQMEALLATAEMEFNGMEFNQVRAAVSAGDAAAKSRVLMGHLVGDMERKGMVDPNPLSNKQMGVYLFGGTHKFTTRPDMIDDDGNKILFKSGPRKGMVRTRVLENTVEIRQTIKPDKAWANKDGYAVNNDILTELARSLIHPGLACFIEWLQEYRALEKDIKTYYLGFSKMVWPDGKIHGHFNHCNTNTGRLSSSSPNMQNITTQEKAT